jgi:hypothetical protein
VRSDIEEGLHRVSRRAKLGSGHDTSQTACKTEAEEDWEEPDTQSGTQTNADHAPWKAALVRTGTEWMRGAVLTEEGCEKDKGYNIQNF